MKFEKIAFVATDVPEAQAARKTLSKRYGDASPEEADVIVALGGDGLMLQTLHQHMQRRIPIYGMNRGSVGFLMNEYRDDSLTERLAAAECATIHPLRMRATLADGSRHEALAINEVALSARPIRPRRSAFPSTARRAWRSSSATACSSRRPPARPPTTSRRKAPSYPSTPRSSH